MALSHDKDGFLTGTPVDIDKSSMARAVSILREIKGDTGKILSSMSKQVSEAVRASKSVVGQAASPRRSASQINAVQAEKIASAAAVKVVRMSSASGSSSASSLRQEVARQQADMVAKAAGATAIHSAGVRKAVAAVEPKRGTNGRFVGTQNQGGDDEDGSGGKGKNKDDDDSVLKRAADGIETAADKISSAAQEAEGIDPVIAATKEIGDIVSPLAKGVFGIGKGVFGLFGKKDDDEKSAVPWYRRIWKELRKQNKDAGASGGSGGLLSGLMSKIPGLGSLAGLAGGAAGLLGTVLTRVFAPVAAIWGAWQVGQWIGGKISDWLTESGVAEKIFDAFDATKEFITSTWKTVTESFQSVVDFLGKAIGFVADLPGKAVDAGKRAWGATKEVAGKGWDATKDAAGKGWEATKGAAGAAKDWVLGKTSKMFESGKGGAGTVSTGKGDYGGASYGTYQLSSSQGTLQKFLKQSGYGDQFAGLKPGSPEFNAKWKEVALADPSFGSKQHDFIKSTHYDPQMKKLADSGIDLSGRGAAVQDAVWSTSVQFGGKSSLIQKALAGKDVASMSDAQLVSAIQDYKLQNNDKLFAKSSDAVRAGTARRAVEEKEALLNLDYASVGAPTKATGGPSAAPAVAMPKSAPAVSAAPSLAKMTPPPMPAPAPTKIGSSAGEGGSGGVTIQREVGQNVADRGIAHVVTGGIGAYEMRA